MNSITGHFLVASPYLPDGNFFRSVVLMVQHNDEGALGLVLNRPVDKRLSEVWEMATGNPCDTSEPLYLGGPCEGPLMCLHRQMQFSEEIVLEDLFFTTDRDNLTGVVNHGEGEFRVFSGYSGWGGGQLDAELEAGGWMTTPATSELVLGDPTDLWKKLTSDIGGEIMLDTLAIKHRPTDPSLN